MPRLSVGLAAMLALAACGPGQVGSGLRDQQLPPQVAAENYARFASSAPRGAQAHALPDQLTPSADTPGDPNVGRTLFIQKGCGGCHTITGLPGAAGVAGPRLDNTVVRGTIAGDQIPATPQNLAQWIYEPASLKPNASMPKPGVSQAEARDIAAFLYSLPQNP